MNFNLKFAALVSVLVILLWFIFHTFLTSTSTDSEAGDPNASATREFSAAGFQAFEEQRQLEAIEKQVKKKRIEEAAKNKKDNTPPSDTTSAQTGSANGQQVANNTTSDANIALTPLQRLQQRQAEVARQRRLLEQELAIKNQPTQETAEPQPADQNQAAQQSGQTRPTSPSERTQQISQAQSEQQTKPTQQTNQANQAQPTPQSGQNTQTSAATRSNQVQHSTQTQQAIKVLEVAAATQQAAQANAQESLKKSDSASLNGAANSQQASAQASNTHIQAIEAVLSVEKSINCQEDYIVGLLFRKNSVAIKGQSLLALDDLIRAHRKCLNSEFLIKTAESDETTVMLNQRRRDEVKYYLLQRSVEKSAINLD